MSHGNYRHITHKEAFDYSTEHNVRLVTVDSVVYRGGPGIGREVYHIVAPNDFYTMDEPVAYSVELVRPMWIYGSEGQLFPLKFLGRLSDEWLDVCESSWFPEDEADDPFPDGDFIWALDNRDDRPAWEEVDWDWYNALRIGARWREGGAK